MAVTWKKLAYYTDITATKLDDFATPDDNSDLDANILRHGLLVKAVGPAPGQINVVGLASGEPTYSNKGLFDATNPAALGTAAQGSAIAVARRDHVHAMPAHASVGNLTADDHAQYALLSGRVGGQVLYGGTAANDDITIEGTSHATKTSSYVLLQPSGGNVGIGVTPATFLHVKGQNVAYRGQLSLEATDYAQLTFYTGATTDTNLGGQIYYLASASRFVIQNYSGGSFGVLALNPEGGNVGIGTTSPGAKLTLSGSSQYWSTLSAIRLDDTSGQSTSRNWIIANQGANYGDFSISQSTTNGGDPGNGGTIRLSILGASGNIVASGKLVTTATLPGDNLAEFTQSSATGYGVVIYPGLDTNYAFGITNAAKNATNVQFWGNGNGYFAGELGVGASPGSGWKLAVGGVVAIGEAGGVDALVRISEWSTWFMDIGYGAGAGYIQGSYHDGAYSTLNLQPSGGIVYAGGNVSAASFTDRTPGYAGDALAEIAAIASDSSGEIDHATLPAFVRRERVAHKKDNRGRKIIETTQERDLGAMISMQTTAIQQLLARVQELEAKLN